MDADVKLEESVPITYPASVQEHCDRVRRDSPRASTDDNGLFVSQSRANQNSAPGLRNHRSSSSETHLVDTFDTPTPQTSERLGHSVEPTEVPAHEVRPQRRTSRYHIANVNRSGAQTTMFAPAALGDDVTWI